MEEKPYKWFLHELCSHNLSFKILETGLCRGTKVIGWYSNTLSDILISKSTKIVNKTRYLLNYFLNQRVPILEEYAPEKLICYLYHKTEKKPVSAKEAIDLAENQLHGLQVTSIHMAVVSTSDIYSISANNLSGELNTEIFTSKFGKPNEQQPVKDSTIVEKIINLLVSISEIMIKISRQEIQEIQIDLLFDAGGVLNIIKITKLIVRISTTRLTFIRKSSVKLVQAGDSSDESLEEEVGPMQIRGAISSRLGKEKEKEKEKEKKEVGLGNVGRPAVKNTQHFLHMIANTFDRERKKYSVQDTGQEKKAVVPLPGGIRNDKVLLKSFSKRNWRDARSLNKSMNSLSDLLVYVEQTRPMIWLKDSNEIQNSIRTPRPCVISRGNSRQVSDQYLTPIAKSNHLEALIHDDNRIGKRLYLRSQITNRYNKLLQ